MEVLKDALHPPSMDQEHQWCLIITTKMGRGRARIEFNPWFSKAEIPKELSLMNSYQFATQVNAQNATSGQPPAFDPAQLAKFQSGPTTDGRKPFSKNHGYRIMI
jgi:hypothetical protein